MRNTRQIIWGIILILVSSALLFGILSLSQAEGITRLSTSTQLPASTLAGLVSPTPNATSTPVIIYTCPTSVPLSCPTYVIPTLPPTPPPTSTIPTLPPALSPTSAISTLPPTPSPTRTAVMLPSIPVTPLPSATPTPGSSQAIFYSPTPTHTGVSCGAPRSWVIYVVQKGDTLYHLGKIYGIPYTEIQRANCLDNFNIRIGQLLYVPPWTPIIPFPTPYYDYYAPTEEPTLYLPFESPATETPVEYYPAP
jgi:LysM repeat protein